MIKNYFDPADCDLPIPLAKAQRLVDAAIHKWLTNSGVSRFTPGDVLVFEIKEVAKAALWSNEIESFFEVAVRWEGETILIDIARKAIV